MSSLSPSQIPGLDIKPPVVDPQPGQVIIGYERYKHEAVCCDCEGMTSDGVACIILLVLFCWPLAFIPCLSEDCRQEFQRPVYGSPGEAPVKPASVGYTAAVVAQHY
eukprot:TRINITY_DN568_c0_g1_i5.p4 TRINITY_DN568_c0_g1~~TRINITY_DN568_c0_g1_i5.p4  ORF type:complete len:107 (+),score=14.02 TRINITY_DN568_c0_g1_i5:112-432(+)